MSRLPILAVWRVLPVRPPALLKRCPRCDEARAFESSGKFRINAQGRRLDVWLVYRCTVCDQTHNREVLARVSPESIPQDTYASYLANDPSEAIAAAFAPGPGRWASSDDFIVDVSHESTSRARLVLPLPINVRLDRVLARALGWSRSAVQAGLRSERVRIDGDTPRPSSPVRDGWTVLIER